MCAGRCAADLVCARDMSGALACAALPARGEPCLADPIQRCQEGLACSDDVCIDPPESGEACLDFSAGLNRCATGLVCGGRLCSVTPGAPGCDACTEPDMSCVVEVCMPEPPLVCSDQGGLLF
jgi:hypothetical protein